MNKKNQIISKKAVTPIIAISLLLVVAVAATLSFSGWYSDLASSLVIKSKNSDQYSELIDLKFIHKQSNDNLLLYYNNEGDDFIFINSLKINDNICTLESSDILEENSLTYVEVSNCNPNSNGVVNVVLFTDTTIIENSNLID